MSYTHFNSVILHKNLLDENGKRTDLSNNNIENSSDENIHQNTEEQILESVKTYLRLYENSKETTLLKNNKIQIFKKYNPMVDHKDYNCTILNL